MMTLPQKLLLLIALLFQSAFIYAEDNSIPISNLTNPARSTGIQIGDVLQRSMTFETSTPQNMITKALPAKGTRNDEVELIAANIVRMKDGSKNQYKLELRYQVFTNATRSKVMALPAQTIKISSTEQLVLPAWRFWFSPLVETSIVNAKANVQPQLKAPTIDLNHHAMGLKVFSVMLILSIIGLIYVNANNQWLPFCKGNFARAHKQIKRISRSKVTDVNRLKKALFSLHASFNKTYGRNLFANDVGDFVSQNPKFKPFQHQILEFFTLSNQSLFSRHRQDDREMLLKLLSISKSLRDCERGV